MDELDFFFIKKLFMNSRLTYRELAEMSNLSVSAVHKRIKNLEDEGIIKAYIAHPSLIALKSLWVMIFGISKARSMHLVSKELGNHKNVNFVGIAGRKSLTISTFLSDISELQELGNFISIAAQISEPFIGIKSLPYCAIPESLTTIDYKILKTLNKDARKPITDIANEVGLSSKTVRKRLDRMIENNLATFTIQWKPLLTSSFLVVFDISLNGGNDLKSTIQHIEEKYSQNLVSCYSYTNIPNKITMEIWAKTAHEAQNIKKSLQTEEFKDIIPYIGLSGSYYDCWIDQLLRTK
jgi:Lrp/AsnC family leucine-responsive transcriptional regulator